ncbi:hypothetical protein GGI43DRAFT_109617 [Trichoderma evansii]
MNENSAEFRTSLAASTCRTYPLSSQALLTGGRNDASTEPQGKLFSRDRGLPRSTSILWPISAQDDSTALIHQCMTSCPDFNRSSKQSGVNGHCRFFNSL